MLAAASTATRNRRPGCARESTLNNSLRVSEQRKQTAPMLQLVGQTARDAKANHSSGGGGPGQRHVLLVPGQTSPPGRRRLPVGDPSGPATGRPAESLRYAIRAVSLTRGIRRAAVFAPAAG